MTKQEIRKKIDANNALMEKVLKPNTFTLNNLEKRKCPASCSTTSIDKESTN